MAGVGPGDLHELASDLLEAATIALDTIPDFAPGFGGAPERRYVSPGEPPADCDQLTVHVELLAEAPTNPQGLGAGRRASYGHVNHVALTLMLYRCIPTGSNTKSTYTPPDPTELGLAAEQLNMDAWAMWNHIHLRIIEGLLFETCKGVFWQGFRSLPIQGGYGGWIGSFLVVLDSYQEVLALS